MNADIFSLFRKKESTANLIIEDSKYVDFYTYLDSVFATIPELRKLYWLITDLECNHCPDPRLREDPVLIEGKTFNEIIQVNEIQFIWGVLSGFSDKPIKIPAKLPYADGNPRFWKGKPKPQATGAEIEIVCWDSTCTLFINANDSVATKLKELYPDIRNLDDENKSKDNLTNRPHTGCK